MMTIDQFIRQCNVRPADALVMQKKYFGMVDHYVIYVGVFNGRHQFVANYRKGVKVITPKEMDEFLLVLQPSQIDRFPGREEDRQYAVQRALSRVGEENYSYLSNNCEHFKNWVHHGQHRSKQVEDAGKAAATGLGVLAVGLLFSAFFSDNK